MLSRVVFAPDDQSAWVAVDLNGETGAIMRLDKVNGQWDQALTGVAAGSRRGTERLRATAGSRLVEDEGVLLRVFPVMLEAP